MTAPAAGFTGGSAGRESGVRGHGRVAAGYGIEKLWYGTSPLDRALRAGLSPLAALFGLAVSTRSSLYDRGLLAIRRAPAPVVSVGALSVGGSGKTPFVLWLAARLAARGLRPCIVTRGYGAAVTVRRPFLLDRTSALEPGTATRAGDEAVLLALRSGLPVAVGRDRAAACELAARELAANSGQAPDLFLLDDGFQHRRLARDLDIVLVGADETSQRLLPAGPLRERASALSRADVVVRRGDWRGAASSSDGASPAATGPTGHAASSGGAISSGHAAPASGSGSPVGDCSTLRLRARTRASAVVRAVTDEGGEHPSFLRGRRVVAVAAIARPHRFVDDLERCGAQVIGLLLYRDHHRYDDDDRRRIAAAARSADFVVTTEKDLVKLAPTAGSKPLLALRVETQVEQELGTEVEQAGTLLERIAGLASFDR